MQERIKFEWQAVEIITALSQLLVHTPTVSSVTAHNRINMHLKDIVPAEQGPCRMEERST